MKTLNRENRVRTVLASFAAALGLLATAPGAALADDHRGYSSERYDGDRGYDRDDRGYDRDQRGYDRDDRGYDRDERGYDRRDDRRTDVVVTAIRVPRYVRRGRTFDILIQVTNSRRGFAPFTTVGFRAELDRRGARRDRDVSFGRSAYFRNLRPGESRWETLRVRAPQRTGRWNLLAELEASGYVDPTNNRRSQTLVVID